MAHQLLAHYNPTSDKCPALTGDMEISAAFFVLRELYSRLPYSPKITRIIRRKGGRKKYEQLPAMQHNSANCMYLSFLYAQERLASLMTFSMIWKRPDLMA
jgi:hypothetical protein